MTTLTQAQLNELTAINLFVVGWGTEGAKSNPYKLVNIYGEEENQWGQTPLKR